MELSENNTNKQKNNMLPEHAVIISFHYPHDNLDVLHELEIRLMKVISDAKAGDYDGHEVAMDDTDATLYMYGPNAEALFKTVKPLLEQTSFMKGAIANLRFGSEDNSPEIDIEI